MKKYVILVAMFICMLSLLGLYFDKEKQEESSKNVLRVGAECDYVPNSWEESRPSNSNHPIANNEGFYAEGYDIQIAKIVASNIEVDLEIKKFAWNDLIPALLNGEIDAIFSSMLDTEERKKLVAFSDPYEANRTEYAIIVDSVGPFISATSLKDFTGAKIVGERGTKLDEVIDQIPGVVHLKPVETIQGMIDMVLQEKADGAVIDVDTGHFHELLNKGLTLVKFSGDNGFKLGFHGVCAGVRKEDAELLHRINIALSKISKTERKNIMIDATSRMMTNAQ